MNAKRKYRRTDLNTCAAVLLNGQRFLSRTLDLSARGAALTSPVWRCTGQPVHVQFYLDDIAGWVGVDGYLVRQARRGVGYVWGVRFDHREKGPLTYLASYVSERLRA